MYGSGCPVSKYKRKYCTLYLISVFRLLPYLCPIRIALHSEKYFVIFIYIIRFQSAFALCSFPCDGRATTG